MSEKTVIAPPVKKVSPPQAKAAVKNTVSSSNSGNIPLLTKPSPRASFLKSTAGKPAQKSNTSSWVFSSAGHNKQSRTESGSSALGGPVITQRFLKSVTPEGTSRPKTKPAATNTTQPVSRKPLIQPVPKEKVIAAKGIHGKLSQPEKKKTTAPTAKKPAIKKESPVKPIASNNTPALTDLQTERVQKNGAPVQQTSKEKIQEKPATSNIAESVKPKGKGNPNSSNNPNAAKEGEERSKNLMNKELQEAKLGGHSEVNYQPGKPTVVKPNSTAIAKIAAAEKKAVAARPVQATAKPAPARQAKKVTAPARKKPQLKKEARPKTAAKNIHPVPVPAGKEDKFDLQKHVPNQPLTTAQIGQAIQRGDHKTGRAQVQQRLQQSNTLAQQSVAKLKSAATQKKSAIAAKKNTVIGQITAQVQQHEQAAETMAAAKINQLQQAKEEKSSALEQAHQDTIQQHNSTTATNRDNGHSNLQEKKENFRQRVMTEKAALTTMANTEADRCDNELESAATEANRQGESVAGQYTGSDDPKPDQQQAARRVGNESAGDIRNKKAPLRSDLQQRAADVSAHYDELLNDIYNKISDAQEQLHQTVDEIGAGSLQELTQKFDQAKNTLQEKLKSGTEALNQQKDTDKTAVRSIKEQRVADIEKLHSETIGHIDTTHEQTSTGIEQMNKQTSEYLSSREPYVPGAMEMIQHNDHSINSDTQKGAHSLQELEKGFGTGADTHAEQTTTSLTQMREQADQRGGGIVQDTQGAMDQVTQSVQNDCKQHEQAMSEKQTGFITELQGEVDKAIGAALEKIAGFKNDFTRQIRQAANDALLEAKKPLYDQTQTRANEAAIRAGESWWEGLLRALGDILIGFIILIIVAVIVAAIAAAFGVLLTAWTAIMIAGAILLVIGLVLALRHRYIQARDGGHSYAIMFWALGDVTGITMIYEAFWAHADAVTGQPLSQGEATYRGFTGIFTAVMLVLGARSAIKGPPGGMFTRPGGIPFEFPRGGWGELVGGLRESWRGFGDLLGGLRESFVGFKEMLPAMWEAARATFTDIITGLVQQGREIIDGIRKRLGRNEPTRPVEADPTIPGATLRAEISKANLRTTQPRYQQGGEGELSQWVWELVADTPEGPAVVSDQYAYTDGPNNPVSGPEQFLRPKQGRLPDGRIIEVKLNDGSWTTESLRMAMEAFRRQFGFTPTNLTGELAEANLRNFQTEYAAARTRNPGGNRQTWSDEAIRNISFGKQRIAMGYDQITAHATGSADITVTDPGGTTRVITDVPDHVSVDARSSGNPTINPPQQQDDDQN